MNLLITAGPTREYIDSVRFLSNPSSGKMGYAIAAEAIRKGHHVELVSGPVDLPIPEGVISTQVTSAEEMFEACQTLFSKCHACVMAAAVSDYKPVQCDQTKTSKKTDEFTLSLTPTLDICASLGRAKRNQILIGFAMEDHDHREHAEEKLGRKKCDAIVLNDITTAGRDSACVEIFRANEGWERAVSGSKKQIAVHILEFVEKIRESQIPTDV